MTDRCDWAGPEDISIAYHDREWGVPVFDGRALWEMLVLEGFQAGLSWIAILKKRDRFRIAFQGFHPETIAGWTEADVARLLADPGIVRHRGKIEAAIRNARAYVELGGHSGFAAMLWDRVDGRPIRNAWRTRSEVPAETAVSRDLSRALRAAGFTFCGPKIVYALMQSAGLVNDHLVRCPRHAEVAELGRH